jgi:sialate O-acetylesterase
VANHMAQHIGRAIAFAILMAASAAHAQPSFHGIFTDHAVLQRDKAIPVWGKAQSSQRVKIMLGDATVEAVADKEGKWRARLPAMKAGGPHKLSVTDSAGGETAISDVLIGDVYLCSGQSNMAMTVNASMNAYNEIRRTDHDRIRMYSVALTAAPSPQDDLPAGGNWKAASAATVGDFSAVCFYFARDLQRTVDVPIGLINSSWGGSAIEAWIGGDELSANGRAADIALLKTYAADEKGAQAKFGKVWETWWAGAALNAGKPWIDKAGAGWAAVPMPMRDWKRWGIADLAQHNGMLWYRKSFTLTAEQAAQASTLHLGAIDEIDMTWVNGQPLAQSFGWATKRDYALPKGMLRAGRNDIVTNVFSDWDMGGMFGPSEAIQLSLTGGSDVALGGGWAYKEDAGPALSPPRAPWLAIGGLSNIGNAMVAPLAPYALTGVIWYQGESNAGRAGEYRPLLASLMRDWRAQFATPDLPFMIVQLPNFGAPVVTPTASGWSDLREAQRLAVQADNAAGLVVTIDSGENDDIHPPNKQIVGARLARLARKLIYKADVTANGPVALSAERRVDGIALRFGGIDGKLVARSAAAPIAFETCGAAQSSCRFAPARIEGDTVILDATTPQSVQRIRYCWGDAPVCTLYDGAGFPAGPFEMAVK